MKLPDGYRPREGDVVIVYAKVKFDFGPGDSYVFLSTADKSITLGLKDIAGVHQQRIDVGDRVMFEDDNHRYACEGEVIAIDGEDAWVRLQDQSSVVKKTNCLGRLFPEPEMPAAEEPPAKPQSRPDGDEEEQTSGK